MSVLSTTELCEYNIIITTGIGKEELTASFIEELCPESKVLARPLGFKGILLVKAPDALKCANVLLREVSFIEKSYVAQECTEARLESVAEAAARLVKEFLDDRTSFAVRTYRRGKHDFTSIDVNIAVGSRVQESTGASVDLEHPDIAIFINIIGNSAFVSVEKGPVLRPKGWKAKFKAYSLFHRLTVVQEPYISHDLDASFKMGERLGRAMQTYEIGRYIVALLKPVPARPLARFIEGVEDGIESRFKVQRKSYSRDVVRTTVEVYEMHLIIRSLRGRPIVIFEPEGKPISQVSDKLRDMILGAKSPVLVFGSREGVPTGLFRFADLVVDVAPGITLSTDQAIPTAIGALMALLVEDEMDESS